MHHIDGALLGLALLYRHSGALPEYCSGYGESFSGPDDFAPALERMFLNYGTWFNAMGRSARRSSRLHRLDNLTTEIQRMTLLHIVPPTRPIHNIMENSESGQASLVNMYLL